MVWQTYVQQWLRETAAARLREHVAAGDASATSHSTELSPADPSPPSHVAIVFSTMAEAGGLLDSLSGTMTIQAGSLRVYEGGLRRRRVAVIVAGSGAESIEDATLALIEGHRPRWVIAAGFATALTADLQRGDIVRADDVVMDGDAPKTLKTDWNLAPRAGESTPEVPADWRVGRVVTSLRQQSDAPWRRALGERLGAAALDKQSAAVVAACRDRQVPAVVLRIIREACDDVVPSDVGHVRGQRTLAGRIGALAGIVLNRPASLKAVWNEKEQDLIISKRLAGCLSELIELLVPRGGAT